jgi:elongation factor Ts
MVEVAASVVKALRDKTGAGMMDCKRALIETSGDLEAAVDWLRKKGLSAAAKRFGRVAAEGLIGVAVAGNRGAMVEVNTETDFVARNDRFKEFVANVAQLALNAHGDVQVLAAMDYPVSGRTVADELTDMIATIGENMMIRRTACLEVATGSIAAYVHSAQGPGLGRIGVLVGLESTGEQGVLERLGKQLAMHVAAANPLVVSRDQVDGAALTREKNILAEQARASGKPEAIIEKMVMGRLGKFYEEVCLLEQTYVIDGESKVAKVIEMTAKEAGAAITVKGFVRFAVGEDAAKKGEGKASVAEHAAGG